MLRSENQKYIDEIHSKGLVDEALTLGFGFFNHSQELYEGIRFMVTPMFCWFMSTDAWTYEDCINKPSSNSTSFKLFKIYEVTRVDNFFIYVKEDGCDDEILLHVIEHDMEYTHHDKINYLYIISA